MEDCNQMRYIRKIKHHLTLPIHYMCSSQSTPCPATSMEFLEGMAFDCLAFFTGFFPMTIYSEHFLKYLTFENHPKQSYFPNKQNWLRTKAFFCQKTLKTTISIAKTKKI